MVPTLAVVLAVLVKLAATPPPFRPGATVYFVTPQSTTLDRALVRLHAVTSPSKPVLCTMPMLRPQTEVDPKIVVEPPKNGAKIRSINAPACIERASR